MYKVPYCDMMKSHIGGFMQCYICGANATNVHNRKNTCEKHRRFLQMQHTAKYDKKYIPFIYELEKLVPKNMECQDCKRIMHWVDDNNRSLGAVLQHYRNKTLAIVCLSCNTKHGMMPGDSYRDVPAGNKMCTKCKTIKPLSMFNPRRDGKIEYPMSKCKACNLSAQQEWRLKNPDKYKALNKKHNVLRKIKGGKSELPTI
jgi:hypothetical protein